GGEPQEDVADRLDPVRVGRRQEESVIEVLGREVVGAVVPVHPAVGPDPGPLVEGIVPHLPAGTPVRADAEDVVAMGWNSSQPLPTLGEEFHAAEDSPGQVDLLRGGFPRLNGPDDLTHQVVSGQVALGDTPQLAVVVAEDTGPAAEIVLVADPEAV